MSRKTKLPKDPHSEAALKWCIDNWGRVEVSTHYAKPIVYLWLDSSDNETASIDLRKLIRRRAPLTGIKKQMAGIVRGKRAKKKEKK